VGFRLARQCTLVAFSVRLCVSGGCMQDDYCATALEMEAGDLAGNI
jgi:hypothetical protein